MPSPQPKKATMARSTGYGGATAFAVVCVVLAIVLAVLRSGSRHPGWQATTGTIQETRIVPENAVETQAGARVTWRAEYKVAYSVESRHYFIWVDSSIRGDTQAEVQALLPRPLPSCRVRYHPEKPGLSVADCRQ